MKQKVTVLGGGAFGTAIATLLSNNGCDVKLWCYEQQVVDQINNLHENKTYLPGITLDEKIKATNNFQDALVGTEWVFEAIPLNFLRNILNQAKDFIKNKKTFVVLSKGIEQDSLLLPTEIIKDVLKSEVEIAVVSGPNFAKEIAKTYYSAATIACNDEIILNNLSELLSNSYFKTEASDDVIGVQISGALKNVITLLIGIAQGYNLGQNTIAYFITKGLKEISELCFVLAGQRETVYGLSGLGDLILTATGELSRNLKFGKDIGRLQLKGNFDCQKFLKNQILPEGINTVQSVYQIIKKRELKLPLLKNIYQIIFEQKSIKELLN